MVFYASFNNISVKSWRSVLLLKETGVHRENHRPACRKSLTNFITLTLLTNPCDKCNMCVTEKNYNPNSIN